MQATWQALQPMQVETSINLATGLLAVRTWGLGSVVADRSAMSNVCSEAMTSGPLDVHDERLELRRLCVGVTDERCQRVHQVSRLGQADEAPVVRQANRVDLPAVTSELRDALGDQCDGLDEAAVGRNLDQVSIADPFGRCELLANLDELLRLDDRAGLDVLGPIVKVLGQPVARCDIREILGGAKGLEVT